MDLLSYGPSQEALHWQLNVQAINAGSSFPTGAPINATACPISGGAEMLMGQARQLITLMLATFPYN